MLFDRPLDRVMVVALVAVLLQVGPCRNTICPADDSLITPCKCVKYFKLIDCEKVDASTDLRKIFTRLNGELEKHNARPVYDQFKLVNSQLSEIGSGGHDIFSGVTFRKIQILRNTRLKRIDPNAFRSSFNTTTELTFEENEVLGASEADNVALFKAVNQFSALQTFRMTDSGVRSVPDSAFHQPQPALRELFLPDNRIERIGDNAFTGLDGLVTINLDGNQISKLSTRSLEMSPSTQSTSSLLNIFLRSNRISSSSFPPGIFSRLRRRVYLNLELNNVTSVPRPIFQSFFLRKNILSLEKNPLRCDCDFKWLLDSNVLYNSSEPKKNYQLRKYQCTSDRDEEQIITEVERDDFKHCPAGANGAAANHRHCIEQALDPEREDACLNTSANRGLSHVIIAHAILFLVFRFLCQQ